MKTITNYHDFYLQCDVLLLAVFEKNRNDNLKNYGLCPSHYLNSPALSWDAMLNMTKVECEFIPDPHMFIFFEKGMRCGTSHISNRYSKASNKYLESYDLKQQSKYIVYLDASNLFSYAISKILPTSGLKWIDPKEFDMNKYTINSSKEWVLEVNLEYPKELRELHKDYGHSH